LVLLIASLLLPILNMGAQVTPLYPTSGNDARKIQGHPVSVNDPNDGNTLVFNQKTNEWVPAPTNLKVGITETIVFTPSNSITVNLPAEGDDTDNGLALTNTIVEALSLPASKIYILIPVGTYYILSSDPINLTSKPIELIGTTSNPDNHHIYSYTAETALYPSIFHLHPQGGIRNVYLEQKASFNLSGDPYDTVAIGFPYLGGTQPYHSGEFQNVRLEGLSGRATFFGAQWDGRYVGVYSLTGLLFCGGTLTGYFRNVISGGENTLIGPVASGIFIDCVGGEGSFGAGNMSGGTWFNCIGGYNSFGGETGGTYVTSATDATISSCTKTGGSFAQTELGGLSAFFKNCQEGTFSIVANV